MAKTKLMMLARKLRKNGNSIKEIALKLHVSSGSVSIWCRDIELTQEQIDNLQRRMKDPYYGKRAIYLKTVKDKKDQTIAKLFLKGKQSISTLSLR
ncbi:hypothetical protein A2690_00290 [Candidatus Roizmanbacteria bacterium RIFCSPHIGHO2_01_FULL_39_12b]|uniref:Uncharacterized protein n=1 Tax=Candidatus Roizmanbacteria bacterium RIFCSPHIGHO2_01_FULL_39_12b TaxID=1802030 RepID=A0A1F7G9A1_9BACT|nr:MAG: hypothetical protein A2690_00290 [Candidatus Roizmanbacteria bacterium RIFCSPHIGHO2_01_FULL_39_12b]OGK46005.1 MAG: hypothetical protein A3B46_00580 [Candidatus Roizmanbacteria bacterium RIFCSPLOWO2_01_FULL_39_19]